MAAFRITGIAEIDRALRELEPKIAKKVLRQACRKALKPVKDAAQANAPVKSGQVKKAIKVKAGKRRRDQIRLDVTIGAGDFVGKQFYGSFLEFGTESIEAREFLRRAYESQQEQARRIAQAEILKGIEREAAK